MRHLASYGPVAIARAVGVACTVSLHVLIARECGPELYAPVAFFVTVFSLAGLLLDFGNEQQLIREGAASSPRARTVYLTGPALAVVLIAGLLLSAAPLGGTFDIEGVVSIFTFGMPALFFWALQLLPRSAMQHAQRFRAMAGIELTGSLTAWSIAGGLFLSTGNPAYYGLYTLLLYAVRSAGYWLRGGVRPTALSGSLRPATYFGSWKLLAISTANRATTTYDDFMVAGSFGASTLGVYHLSYRVITLMQDFIAGVLGTLSYPVYTAQGDRPSVVYRQFCFDSTLVFAFSAPLLTLLILTADWSIPLVLSAEWSGAVLIFQLLALEALRQSLLPLAGQALIAMSREKVLLRFTLISAAVLLPAFTLLALFDLIIFVAGFLVVNTLLNIYYYVEVLRAFAQPSRMLLFAWLPGAAVSLSIAGMHLLLVVLDAEGAAHALLLLLGALPLAWLLYRRQFTDVAHALRHLRRQGQSDDDGADGAGESGGTRDAPSLVVHTDAAFAEDNTHLREVHEELLRRDRTMRIEELHYRRDVCNGVRRLLGGAGRRTNAPQHVVHLHFPVFCYQADSLPASMLRGSKYLILLAILRVTGMRLVVSLHDAGAHDFPHRRWEAVFLAALFQSADLAITYSSRGAVLLEQRYGRQSRIAVLPHALYRPFPATRSREALRAEMKIPQARTVLLLFGTRRPYKGFDDVVAALRDGPGGEVTLLLAGKDMAPLAERCAEAGIDVRLREGWLSQEVLADCIAAADYGVLPYRRILHSGSAMYLLSHGCPVIVPDRGVFPEYMAACDIGFMYRGGDVDDLARALAAARGRTRESFSQEIRRFAGAHGVEHAAAMLAAAYARVRS
ncbi:MAG: oligosaccharide flippase family protein [Bacteroidota bacterium]|nr:oligosaccharide flippase family protein [Bacteroidota bacterium]